MPRTEATKAPEPTGEKPPKPGYVEYKGRFISPARAAYYSKMKEDSKAGKGWGGKQAVPFSKGSPAVSHAPPAAPAPKSAKDAPPVPAPPAPVAKATPGAAPEAPVLENWHFGHGLPDLTKGGFFQKLPKFNFPKPGRRDEK